MKLRVFIIILGIKQIRRNFVEKVIPCVVCNEMRRRNVVVVFLKKDYDFLKDEEQEAFLKSIELCKRDILYVCKDCNFSLRGLETCKGENVYSEMTNFSSFLCTCCHKVFHIRKQVNLFKRKNYDFGNKIVGEALSKEFRCKNSIYEFICVECHGCLRSAKGKFPRFPKDAFCQKEKCDNNCDPVSIGVKYAKKCDKLNNGKKCDKVIGRRNTSTTVDWNGILRRMEKCSNFEDLKRYVINLKLPSLPSKFEKNKQLDSDRRDALAYEFLPSDFGVNRGQLFPVASSGGGSCFYYSLSRWVYGDESHCVEMRV